MAQVTRFEDLVAWQRSRELAAQVHQALRATPARRDFGYWGQITRAVMSVSSNIAEGFDRGSRAEFHHFLAIAKGSCAEVRSLLWNGLDFGYLDPETHRRLIDSSDEVSRIIGALKASVARQRDADREKS